MLYFLGIIKFDVILLSLNSLLSFQVRNFMLFDLVEFRLS